MQNCIFTREGNEGKASMKNIITKMNQPQITGRLIVAIAAMVLCTIQYATAQENEAFDFYKYSTAIKKERYKIAIITPMYLDSFDLAKNLVPLPKFASPGIDYYMGSLVASDTLKRMNVPIDLHIYDSKSRFMNMQTLVESDKLDSMDVIIGNVSSTELNLLADFANNKKINFVSAVSPADGGQNNNPFFTLLQPRLITHIEKIYNTINTEHANSNVVFMNRGVNNETNANTYFKNIQIANGAKNKILQKNILIKNDIASTEIIRKQLDSTKDNLIVCAILDPQVAYDNLLVFQQLASQGYKIKVFGMPSWDNIKGLKEADELQNLEVYFTTAQLLEKNNASTNFVQKEFKKRMGTNATDMTMKAANALYYFANLLVNHGVPFNTNMNDASANFTTNLNIQPAFDNGNFKFWENKFLYLVKYKNGLQTYE
jgi:ABC-type branched-subunit amino acid transport system substrate-binding protein